MTGPIGALIWKACFAFTPLVAVPVAAAPVVVADLAPPVLVQKPAAPAKPTPSKKADAKKKEETPADPAAALVAKVQAFYERTKDFTASFDQIYRYTTMTRRLSSQGTVQVKKPGLMRWDYALPTVKTFVVDGKSLWIHEPEENSVMVQRRFSQDSLSAAVSFLWGRGRLADEFDVTLVERRDVGTTVLLLVPKRPQPGFAKVYFSVAPETGAVLASLVIDTQGNENRITFKDVKTDTGLSDTAFRFEPPKGATVKEFGGG